jgi:hypothetical protein
MKPWYMKKKIWVAVITAIASGVGYATGDKDIGNAILITGTTLIGALGLEDVGKAKNDTANNCVKGQKAGD